MPRRLPWLEAAAQKKESKRAEVSSIAATKRQQVNSWDDDLVDADLNDLKPHSPVRREKKRLARTPSTSPPPAPPDVEYMREGAQADDVYMMVEDEFHSTAQMFTQHIHHAEYVRLKKLAKSRGAGTLQDIQRPVDGRTKQSKGLQVRMEVEENEKRARDGRKKMKGSDESSEEEEDYMRDPFLASLMKGEKAVSKDLSGIMKSKSNTRAAAGFAQSPQNLERKRDAFAARVKTEPMASSRKADKALKEEAFSTDAEDDLDVLPAQPSKPIFTKHERSLVAADGDIKSTEARDKKGAEATSGFFKRFTKPAQGGSPKDKHKQATPIKAEREDLLDIGHSTFALPIDTFADHNTQSNAASDFLARRRADKEKKERDEKRKAKGVDDIPTFLF